MSKAYKRAIRRAALQRFRAIVKHMGKRNSLTASQA
jgi:hypothetical protein